MKRGKNHFAMHNPRGAKKGESSEDSQSTMRDLRARLHTVENRLRESEEMLADSESKHFALLGEFMLGLKKRIDKFEKDRVESEAIRYASIMDRLDDLQSRFADASLMNGTPLDGGLTTSTALTHYNKDKKDRHTTEVWNQLEQSMMEQRALDDRVQNQERMNYEAGSKQIEFEQRLRRLETIQTKAKHVPALPPAPVHDAMKNVYTWVVNGISTLVKGNTSGRCHESPPFFLCTRFVSNVHASAVSYRGQLRAYFNGCEEKAEGYLSLYFRLISGPHDDFLPWPFAIRFTLSVLNYETLREVPDLTFTIAPSEDGTPNCWKRPTAGGKSVGCGCPNFSRLDDLLPHINNDRLILQIKFHYP